MLLLPGKLIGALSHEPSDLVVCAASKDALGQVFDLIWRKALALAMGAPMIGDLLAVLLSCLRVHSVPV